MKSARPTEEKGLPEMECRNKDGQMGIVDTKASAKKKKK